MSHAPNGEWKPACECNGHIVLSLTRREPPAPHVMSAGLTSGRSVTEAEWQFLLGAKAVFRAWQDMPRDERKAIVAKHYSFEWGFGQMEEWQPEIQLEQQDKLRGVVEGE